MLIRSSICLAVCMILVPVRFLFAEETKPGPAEELAGFGKVWNDEDWLPPGNGRFTRYLRPLDDIGWKTRMRTFQALVAGGRASVETLVTALGKGEPAERILAAQTLGFLGSEAPRAALLEAAKNDAAPAVRLHAVDSLGMLGGADLTQELVAMEEAEKDRDVKRHISYARERRAAGLDPSIAQKLIKWDERQIDSAEIGKAAPDFELSALTGETIRLSDCRGKKAVVLVFIYGDT